MVRACALRECVCLRMRECLCMCESSGLIGGEASFAVGRNGQNSSTNCPAAALTYRQPDAHMHARAHNFPTCFLPRSTATLMPGNLGVRGDAGGVWALGYMAHGTHGCQGHFDLCYTPTCRVWGVRGGTISPPYSILTPSYPQTYSSLWPQPQWWSLMTGEPNAGPVGNMDALTVTSRVIRTAG